MEMKFGLRHVQVFMMILVIMVAYIMRVNLSVAIVAMTNKTSANPNFPEYRWSESEKGRILSSFFWGYLLLQIFIGNMAEKYGAKLFLVGAMLICSVLTIITPFLAPYGSTVVCILRMLIGAAQGTFYPSVMVLISKWVPTEERGSSFSFTYSGCNIGTLIGLPLSGYLSSSSGGWPSVFYVTGGLGIVWVLAWMWIGASTPAEHSGISEEERSQIELSIQSSTSVEKLPTPWREIATSLPVWCLLIAHLGQNWGFWTLLTEMPNYINSVLGFNIKSNGFLSSLPYLVGWIAAILFSSMSTYMIERNITSKTLQRKILNTIAFWGCALSLLILALLNTVNPVIAIFLLTLAVALDSAVYSGFIISHVDLSPNFCGTLMGITNSLSNITSILAPLCVGWIVTDSSSVYEWKTIFILSGAVMFAANLFYIIFGTSELQPWNDAVTLRETEHLLTDKQTNEKLAESTSELEE